MELELSRVDYTIVGLTSLNCMQLLPPNLPKEQQKVVTADSDGILQIFSIKKEDIQIHFKTLPGPKITSLQLGGIPGSAADKIFVAAENEVRGYTKKGKVFLTFDSSMTENVSSMYVLGNELFLCGKHIYNHYRDCKDVGSYLCGDRITDVIAFYSEKTKRLTSLIACEGRMIRALEHARVTLTMEVDSAPTVLHIFQDENKTKTILFGTIDGRVGILDLERLNGFERWLINNETYNSAVSCIDSYDMSGNEVKNLVIGRQDGNIEVYVVNIADAMEVSTLIFVHNCNESVTSVKCGIVGNMGYDEILVATYTGRVFGLTTEIIDKTIDGDKGTGNFNISGDTTHKIVRLKSDIEDLQQKVLKEREKYQSSTLSFFEELSAIPLLSVKDSMILTKETATYTLSIEVPTAIDSILLQSDVKLDLLDVEKNSAVISYSESDETNNNYLLATYRCQINTNRLELKIRTVEGQSGTLQAYVTPLVQPKCSRLKQYQIKPLSLHYRIHQFDYNRPLNVLSIKGPFSLAEIHAWIVQCVPEVPEKPTATEKTVLMFKCTFLDTILECSYQKGEGEFKSDNVSTISILKDYLTKSATKKKIKIDINISINDDSINYVIKLFEDKMVEQQILQKQITLLDALNELEVNEEETVNYLSSKYKDLLKREQEIRNRFQNHPDYLNRFYGVITDLFVDYNKFKGHNFKMKTPKLLENVENYSYEKLLHFFRPELQQKF